jgi:hypothetical protein
MTGYNASKSIDSEIRNNLEIIEFLKAKKLYVLALKQIKALKKIGYRNERFGYLTELINLEIEIYKSHPNINQLRKLLIQAEIEFLNILDKQEEYISNKHSFNQIYFLFRSYGHARSAKMIDMLRSALPKSKLSTCKSNSARFYHIRCSILFSEATGKYIAFRNFAKQLYDSLDRESYELIRIKSLHISILFTYGNACFQYGDLQTTIKIIKELDMIKAISNEDQFMQKERSYYLKTQVKLATEDYYGAAALLPEIKQAMSSKGLNYDFELELMILIVRTMIGQHNFKLAKLWNNKVINFDKRTIRKDLTHMAKIYEILILFAEDEMELVNFKIANIKQYLQRKSMLLNTEKAIIKMIQQLLAEPSKKTLIFEEITTTLNQLEKNNFEHIHIVKFGVKNLIETFKAGLNKSSLSNRLKNTN